jgi:hypothetical protein
LEDENEKKNQFKKKNLKEHQNQFVLTFKIYDFAHEVGTNHIEGKPKKTTNQDS